MKLNQLRDVSKEPQEEAESRGVLAMYEEDSPVQGSCLNSSCAGTGRSH